MMDKTWNGTILWPVHALRDLFSRNDVYIPLLQRNYKWDKHTAAKLAGDLYTAYAEKRSAYTVGMITLYVEPATNRYQIIDGQQRCITISMLLRWLGQAPLTFRFERDDGLPEGACTRRGFLEALPAMHSDGNSADCRRMKENYEAIAEVLHGKHMTDEQRTAFFDYILSQVVMAVYLSTNPPYDEFLNINLHKTPFVISDRIKANLVIDAPNTQEKDEILSLFADLSACLYENDALWKLVSRNYCDDKQTPAMGERQKDIHYCDENRLKLLCCHRYGETALDGQNTAGYQFAKERKALVHTLERLTELKTEIEGDRWNLYNGWWMLHALHPQKLRFFELLETHRDCDHLERIWLERIRTEQPVNRALLIQSQMEEKPYQEEKEKQFPDPSMLRDAASGKDKTWCNPGTDADFQFFFEAYETYIQQKYKERKEESI